MVLIQLLLPTSATGGTAWRHSLSPDAIKPAA
jgi:hypothetical protein